MSRTRLAMFVGAAALLLAACSSSPKSNNTTTTGAAVTTSSEPATTATTAASSTTPTTGAATSTTAGGGALVWDLEGNVQRLLLGDVCPQVDGGLVEADRRHQPLSAATNNQHQREC